MSRSPVSLAATDVPGIPGGASGGSSAHASGDPLRVAVLAHVRHPIRRPFAGGIEAHTWHLVRALAARGHEVTLYAAGDSDAAGRLVPIVPEHCERRLPWARYRDSERLRTRLDAAFDGACRAIANGDHDVVHCNGLHPHPIEVARRDAVPTLVSLHVPPFPRLRAAVDGGSAPTLRFTVTSDRQRAIWLAETTSHEDIHTVHNGIDPADWPFRAGGDGTAFWAGRITPNKGTHLAAEAAHRAGVGLSIAGPIEDRDYFERAVVPHLHGAVRYVGHLDDAALSTRLGRASALLFTPLWEEPFGLVAVEAMACGLPVAHIDRGAAGEVVGEAGVGAGGEDAAALAVALRRALDVPREVPRQRVERCFTTARMLDGYERLYRECIDGTRTATRRACR